VSSTAETIERAIVFEEVSGVRKVCALRCLSSWPVLFANSLVDVDVGVRVKGLLVFIVLRFREDQFDDALDDQFEAVVEQAGGTSVALSDLSIHERAIFLARLRMCVHRRMGVKPESAHEVLSKILSIIERVTAGVEPERRQTVRYPVKAEATLTIGDRKQETWVDNGGRRLRAHRRQAADAERDEPRGAVAEGCGEGQRHGGERAGARRGREVRPRHQPRQQPFGAAREPAADASAAGGAGADARAADAPARGPAKA
jgi:hypothetical protein